MSTNDVVDFFVTSLTQFSSSKVVWLVCKGLLTNCVGVQDDLAEAQAQAIRMAENVVSSGRTAQVHLEDLDAGRWHTVWSPPGAALRFP